MRASQIRAEARQAMSGKWGKAAIMSLLYFLFTFILSLFLYIPVAGTLLYYLFLIPLGYGIVVSYMKLMRNENVSFFGFLDTGFSNIGRVWKLIGRTFLKLLPLFLLGFFSAFLFGFCTALYDIGLYINTLCSVLIVISFAIYIISLIWLVPKSYLYVLTFFLLKDNPDMSTKAIVQKSEELMYGNRWRNFCLYLSFIGWAILSVFTLGIGLLWLTPYLLIAQVCFYENLLKSNPVLKDKKN